MEGMGEEKSRVAVEGASKTMVVGVAWMQLDLWEEPCPDQLEGLWEHFGIRPEVHDGLLVAGGHLEYRADFVVLDLAQDGHSVLHL